MPDKKEDGQNDKTISKLFEADKVLLPPVDSKEPVSFLTEVPNEVTPKPTKTRFNSRNKIKKPVAAEELKQVMKLKKRNRTKINLQ